MKGSPVNLVVWKTVLAAVESRNQSVVPEKKPHSPLNRITARVINTVNAACKYSTQPSTRRRGFFMPHLFDPFTLRGVTLRNRIGVSPMCQFSAVDGFVNDWHLVHVGARAAGGAGLVFTEATAVVPEGRIAGSDLGLWNDEQIEGQRRLASFIASQGAVPGIQLGHAGRKASRQTPWDFDPKSGQGKALRPGEGGWQTVSASPTPFDIDLLNPLELSPNDIAEIIDSFVEAARRADQAGFQWLEVHAAHGYLLHSFCSPISNQRKDEYGGSLEGRVRFNRELARALRTAWPDDKVLSFRISWTDWVEGGWSLDDSIQLAKWLKEDGVDLIDASSGGSIPKPNIPFELGYQVPGAKAIRAEAKMPTAAVGLIVDPHQADQIIYDESADLVYLGREMLRDPNWPMRAALALNENERTRVPVQYNMAWLRLGNFSIEPVYNPSSLRGLDQRASK
jgi:2,4-dienoyl-CoA reductase-like NADH-dependent reductase (Old Yellow Enzyme family)